ncbi:GNAT family N-acetyltransferase [Hymenobacter sp. BT491]|uniref:GNAT family N-acetyltransferase n=1 Tax=Hymenobacter sp. BT491 TaxID=2766779 RepID=UPI0016537A78|nr:GNAT family N-acetyltransferase [Hymenobacter sp. BT491]MBC6988186.1 GNAT family N-acetyltransferase [Hymenobacter sp. BT491]
MPVSSSYTTQIQPLTPVLETERLRLRGLQTQDLDEFLVMWSDPEFFRYLGGKPQKREEVWRRMIAQQGHWSLMGYGYWGVEEKSTGRFVGNVGFADFRRDLTPSIEGMPEIGWVLAPRVHGLGYATEAVQAALEWGEQHFEPKQIACIIDPDNAASLRVAHKFGFQEIARTTYNNEPILVLQR